MYNRIMIIIIQSDKFCVKQIIDAWQKVLLHLTSGHKESYEKLLDKAVLG